MKKIVITFLCAVLLSSCTNNVEKNITDPVATITAQPINVTDAPAKSPQQTKKTVVQTKTPVATAQPMIDIIDLQVVDDLGTVILVDTPKYVEGKSVLEYLLESAKAKGIPVSFSGSKSNAYVRGINNLFEFDKGALSGWLYFANGQKPSVSCSKYIPEKNAKILWRYTVNGE